MVDKCPHTAPSMAHTPPGRSREEVYRFVRQRLLEGEPPTVREVQEAMGFAAVESARKHLEALVAEGRLSKSIGRARGFRLPEDLRAPVAMPVPIVGEVQAGALTEAIQDPDGWVAVDSRFDPEELFALRVRGNSMVGAGILAGDLVIVRQQTRARSGDVVVAMVEGEATVKTLRMRGRRAELHAANPDYAPIVPEGGKLELLGVVIEVRRQLA